MKRSLGVVGVLAFTLGAWFAATSNSGAAADTVDLLSCDGATRTVLAATTVPLAGPTFLSTNKGIVDDFLVSNTTTLRVNGGATNVNASWSVPAQRSDATLGTVWVTSWQRSFAAPPVGAPARLGLDVVLAHDIPDLTVPPKSRPVKFLAGLWTAAGCTLVSGAPITAALGGTVKTADSAFTLTVPPGAITDTTIVVQPATVTTPLPTGTQAGPAYEITTATATTLTQPVGLTLAYTTGTPASIHVAGESNGVWRVLPSTVDATAATASARTRHFSTYTTTATPGFHIIGGHVSALADAAPIAGINVLVEDASLLTDIASTTTDAFGDYSALVADGGSYKVLFYSSAGAMWAAQWADGQQSAATARVITITTADAIADAQLAPGAVLHGVITDTANAPLAGVFVGIYTASPCCDAVAGVTTGADGSYWLAAGAGGYKLRVAGPPAPAAYVPQWYPSRSVPDGGAKTFTFVADQLQNVTLQPGIRVNGTATDGTNPVANVQVAAIDAAPFCCSQRANVRSKADGSFSLVVPPGSFKFRVTPPIGAPYAGQWDAGRASWGSADVHTYALGTAAAPLTEVLSAGFVVTGTVTDANAPIPNANVSAQEVLATGLGFAHGTTTAADGTYTFRLLSATYKLQANAPGTTYLARWYPAAPSSSAAQPITLDATTAPFTANVALPQGYVISGRITDATSTAGLDGVNISPMLPPATPQQGTGLNGTTTAGGGFYSLVVPSGSYILGVNGQNVGHGFLWYTPTGGTSDVTNAFVVAVPPPAAGLNLALPAVQRITGTVRAAGGGALSGVNVNAVDATANGCCVGITGAPTDASGRYTLFVPVGRNVKIRFDPSRLNAAGTAYLEQYWDHAATYGAAGTITTVAGALTVADADLAQGYRISGRVTDAANPTLGISGVFVNANDAATPASNCCPNPVGGATTDGTGTYSFVVPSGTYKVFVNTQNTNYLARWYDGTAGGAQDFSNALALPVSVDQTLNQTLQLGVRISGRITDASGTVGLANVDVSAQRDLPGGNCCQWSGARTNGSGYFTFVVLAGSYKIQANPSPQTTGTYLSRWWRDSGDPSAADLLDTASADAQNVLIRLPQGYLLTGRITDAANHPIAGSSVNAQTPQGPSSCCTGIGGAATDTNGNFRLVVPQGDWLVSFDAPAPYLQSWWQNASDWQHATPITFGPAQTIFDVGTVQLQTAFVIRGHVTNAAGAPVADVDLNVRTSPNTCCVTGARTDATGGYEIRVAAGTYLLCADPRHASAPYLDQCWNGRATPDTADPITGLAGGSTTADFHLASAYLVTGIVRDAATGLPVAGADVSLVRGSATSCCEGLGSDRTDSLGAFRLTFVGGPVKLQVHAPAGTRLVSQWYDGATGTLSFTAALDIAGDTTTAPINLTSGVLINGRVLVGPSSPLANVWVNATPTGPCCSPTPLGGSTDSAGQFAFAVPANALFRLNIGPPQQLDLLWQWYSTTDPGTRDWSRASDVGGSADFSVSDVTLLPGVRLTGRLATSDGSAIQFVNIQVFLGGANGCCIWQNGTQTRAPGTWSFVVPAGAVRLQFSPPLGSPYATAWYGGTSFETALDVSGPAAGLDVTLQRYPAPEAASVGVTPTLAGIAVDPARNRIYAASQAPGHRINVIDATTYQVIDWIDMRYGATAMDPDQIAVDPASGKLVVSFGCCDKVAVIDPASHTVRWVFAAGHPLGLAIDTARGRAYVAIQNGLAATQSYVIIDIATATVPTSVLDGGGYSGVAYDASTNRLYFADPTENLVTVVDATTFSQIATVAVPGAFSIAVDSSTHRAFVASQSGGTLTVVDGITLGASLSLGAGSHGLALDPVTHAVYVSNRDGGTVMRVDASTLAATTLFSAADPGAVALNTNDGRLYLVLGTSTLAILQP